MIRRFVSPGAVALFLLVLLIVALVEYVFMRTRKLKPGTAAWFTSYVNLATAMADPKCEVFVIDVRMPKEFARNHILGAVNIPHKSMGRQLPTKDKSAWIVLYSSFGFRAEMARRRLKKMGYRRVVNFGAMRKWRGLIASGKEALSGRDIIDG